MDKINPTKEEIQEEYKKHQEFVKSLPRIDCTHLQEIKKFLETHSNINNAKIASDVLAYLLPLKSEWKEYYQIVDSFVYPQIYESISHSYKVLGKPQQGVIVLRECLDVIENAVEYKWLFQVKSQLFQLLALLYFTMDDIKNTKNALSNSVFYYLSHSNHTHYDNFEFYSFRPISDYLLDSISHNYITLTNPQQFNDPVDPALLSHLDYLINHTKNEKDKELYMLQKEVYSKVRIRCLVRSLPLPQKEGRDVSVVNDSERERNFTTMWAYYADYHRGICIKYVFPSTLTSHETNKDAVLILNNVEYKKIYNPDNIHFNLNDALFGKGEHWQYEHECRFVYFHRHKEDEYMKINIPEECITEIYIGVRTSLEDKLKLKEALKNKPNIKLFQMRISNSNLFQLDVETLDREKWLNDI